MKCINPKMKELISLYQFNLLGGEDKLKVEAHLLECDACFAEVYRLSPAVKIMEKEPKFFLNALQSKKDADTMISKLGKEIAKRMAMIFSSLKNWWDAPVVKILVPVTALAIILFIIVSPETKRYSDLAIFDNVSSSALKVRDFVEDSQMVFDRGVKYFEEKNYSEAIRHFKIYIKKEKNNAYAYYYLGVSLVLTGNVGKGIERLERAEKISKDEGQEILLERCYWYLGNAYLKNNKAEKAFKKFRSVVAIGGEFKDDALQQMSRIEDMRGQ